MILKFTADGRFVRQIGRRGASTGNADTANVHQPGDVFVHEATNELRTSRPTAVNLFWALDRMDGVAEAHRHLGAPALLDRLLQEARTIAAEDRAMCRAIGNLGAGLIGPGQGVLTHCNAGGLATARGAAGGAARSGGLFRGGGVPVTAVPAQLVGAGGFPGSLVPALRVAFGGLPSWDR